MAGKETKSSEPNKQAPLRLRHLPNRARRGVPLARSALVLNLTAGRGYGEGGPTLLFHARPDDRPPDLCLGGIYHLPKVGDAANPHTQTHTLAHSPTHTRSHSHSHYAHVGPVTRIHAGILSHLSHSRLFSARDSLPLDPCAVPGPHMRSAESSEMRVCVYCKPATLTEP